MRDVSEAWALCFKLSDSEQSDPSKDWAGDLAKTGMSQACPQFWQKERLGPAKANRIIPVTAVAQRLRATEAYRIGSITVDSSSDHLLFKNRHPYSPRSLRLPSLCQLGWRPFSFSCI